MELKKYKLGEIAEIEISGVDKKSKEGEIPVKLCNFVDVYHNWAITKDLTNKFMNATAKQSEIDVFKLKKGQVAFTKDSETRDDIGVPTYIADDFDNVILGYHTALITPDKTKIDGKYLNAFMNTRYIQKYFENNATGSGQRYTLSNDTLYNIPIIAPDLETQKLIGNFLSNIDKKIALNARINARLERLAKRLYDYWFVQFDFPNEEGKPYKTSGGKMVYNEILKREIPDGWEVKQLGEIILKIDSGKRPSGGINKELKFGIPSLGAECIDDLGVFDFSSTPFIDISYRNKMTTGRICNNDILVYKDGAYVGKTTLFRDNFPYKEAFVNEHVFLIHAQEECIEEYLYFSLKQKTYFQIMQNLGKAKAAQPGLNREDMKNILFIVPSKNIVCTFHNKVELLFENLFNNAKAIRNLTALRDRLLPLLMNGQVIAK